MKKFSMSYTIKYTLDVLAILVCSFFIFSVSGSQKDKIPPSHITISYQSTADSISLSWTPSSDLSGISSYIVYRDGMDLGYTASTSFQDTGLQEYTSYTYTIQIKDNAGNFTADSISATTLDLYPPTAPTGLTYTATSGSISLSWIASTDTGGMSGYKLYNNDKYIGFTESTAYNFEGLQEYTEYSLKVEAVDRAGKTTPTEILAQTEDATPPTEPANLSYTATADTAVLSWAASTDSGVGMGSYLVYRNDTKIASVNTTSYTDTGLTGNTDYTYKVEAYDKNNNGSSSSSISVHTYDDTVKVLSFNILFQIDTSAASNDPNSSAVRIPKVKEYFDQYKPDVLGLQEMDVFWFGELSSSMTDYATVGGTNQNVNYDCPIFYLKNKYDLINSGTQWLGKAYGEELESNQHWYRVYTWAVLRDKVTKKEFVIINTHLDDGVITNDADKAAVQALRKREAEGVMAKINELKKTYKAPIVCTGDFNEDSSVPKGVYDTMTSGILQDACAVAGTTVNTGVTYHENVTVKSNQNFKGLPIDYCFVNDCNVLSYCVTRDYYRSSNGSRSYPSDHFGVLVQLKPQ